MRTSRNHRVGFLVGLACLVAAPAAGADTLCVNTPTGAGCDLTYSASQLQGALNEAAAASEQDVVRIGPGTYTGTFTYNGPASSDEIVGAGPSTQFVAPAGLTGFALKSPGSTLRHVSLRAGGDNAHALRVVGGTVEDLSVTSAPGVLNTRGISTATHTATIRGVSSE